MQEPPEPREHPLVGQRFGGGHRVELGTRAEQGDDLASRATTIADIGIGAPVLRTRHGQGFATEALRALLNAAIVTGRSRIWSTARSDNAPSLRVLDKFEFRRDHTTTDADGQVVSLVFDH